MHGAEHLHVAPRIKPEAAWQTVGHDVDDQVGQALGVVLGEEEEILQALHHGHLAGIDTMGVGHDAALLGLPEDMGEAHAGENT